MGSTPFDGPSGKAPAFAKTYLAARPLIPYRVPDCFQGIYIDSIPSEDWPYGGLIYFYL